MSGIRINLATPRRPEIASRQRRRRRRLVDAWLATLLLLGLFAPICAADSAGLAQKVAAAEARLEELLTRFTDRHPDVIAARASLRDLRSASAEAQSATRPAAVASEPTFAPNPASASPARPPAPATTQPAPRSLARERRVSRLVADSAELCAAPGVLACFDFEGDSPLASKTGEVTGSLSASSDGRVRARPYTGRETRGGAAVRMDFRPEDAADHGTFTFTLDAFEEGDRLSVQWRQWFSPELITRFADDGTRVLPQVGGGGAKQLGITEIGDPHGCSFGEVVVGNPYWVGALAIYHGCNLWFRPNTPAPAGPADASDYDFQPGGDNVCRYRYYRNSLNLGVDYLYPTVPANLLDVPGLGAVVHPERYHGCLGWAAGQWMAFRLEIDIAYCRVPWSGNSVPAACADTSGRLRYWVKYADERQPWLVIDQPMPLRWRAGHSGRYGRFLFQPYNTGEQPLTGKPPAFTLYDDIVVARNATDLPWPEQ